MRTLFLALSIVGAHVVSGQALDPSRFFPLDAGNAWHFAGTYSATFKNGGGGVSTFQTTFVETYEVTGSRSLRDTLYAEVEVWRSRPGSATLELWRYDSRTASFLARGAAGSEHPVLGILFGSALREGAYPGQPPFGWSEPFRVYAGGFQCGLGGVRLQYERGPYDISSSGSGPYACSSFAKLVYARLGGVEYGQAVATTSESVPGTAEALQVWPNPARGQATVQSAAGVEVRVFDLLGRDVLRVVTGADGQVALQLAPGRYIVRAGGDHQKLVIR